MDGAGSAHSLSHDPILALLGLGSPSYITASRNRRSRRPFVKDWMIARLVFSIFINSTKMSEIPKK
jgi:hypothetical protein